MGIPQFPPRFDTSLVKPFYEGLAEGELRMPACPECGKLHWYPPEVLPCHPERKAEWRSVSPEGKVYTFTTVTRSLLPGDDNATAPYEVVLVEPDALPGAKIVGLFVGGTQPSCGQRVRLSPVDTGGDVSLPGFQPAAD